MKVKLEKQEKQEEQEEQEEIQEEDVLPEGTETTEAEVKEKDVARELELKNARLEGQLEAMKDKPKPQPEMDLAERQRIQVLNDTNGLDDEAFEKIYKAPKHQVMATLLDNQIRTNQSKTNQRIAEAEARAELSNKYGKDVSNFRKELNEALDDASPAVRQDPERLASFLERQYLALSKQNEVKKLAPKKEEDVQRRKIVQDFAKPGVEGADLKSKEEPKDELKEDLKSLGSRWDIKTESERKKYLGKIVHVDMDFGSGIVLKKTGFEIGTPADKK